MAATLRDVVRVFPGELAGDGMTRESEQFRLDRLLELRAVIDSLRAERGQQPPGDPCLQEGLVELDRYSS